MAPLPIFDTSPREMIEIDDDFVEVKRPESIISLSEDEEGSPARFMFEEDISDDSNDDVFEEVDDADWRERQAERQASSLLPPGHTFEDSVSFGFVTLTPGMTPELQDGDFLRIKHIVRDLTIDRPTQAVYLHGKRLRRCRKVENMLQKKLNELCMLVEDDLTDSRPAEQQELVKIPLEDVICVREVIFTNLLFPALSFRQTGLCYRSALAIEEQAVLVCRWKYTTEYDTPPGRSNGYVVQRALTRLSDDECDPNRGKSDVLLRRDWRMIAQEKEDTKQKQALKALAKEGSVSSVPSLTAHMVDLTVDDRSPVPKKRSRDIIEIDSSDDDMEIIETTKTIKRKTRDGVYERRKVTTESFKPSRRSTSTGTLLGIPPQQQQLVVKLKYTYGDMCAGAGGTTRGAMMAGLNFAWVLDHWDRACDTQRRNFPGGTVLEMDIHEYCTTEMEVRLVDVLHISFPCQPHSPIHTREGRNDGANMAAGYSAVPILLKSRPRVITLEQTPGIMTHRGGWHFRALINQLTSVNYSVRWKIMNFAEYGNSQPRKRLIIIASCPGETLPPFPKPTHGTTPGLKPFVTIKDCIGRIKERDLTPVMGYSTKKDERPYDSRVQLKQCITTDGGAGNTHPSGKRSFNLRELAALQGFPIFHKFSGGVTDIRRQIGNAVPPIFAKALYDAIIPVLRASDRATAAYKDEVMSLD